MNYEIIATALLLVLCWLVLAVTDVVVSALVALLGGTKFGKVFLWGLLSFAVPVAGLVYGTLIERNLIQVKQVTVKFPSLPATFDGFTVAQISDIHLRSFSHRPESLRKAVDRLNALNADIVCFTGDLITVDASEMDGFEDILGGIKSPVYAVLGNHDYHIYKDGRKRPDKSVSQAGLEELKTRERSLGWDLLLNENRIITRGGDSLAVIGVENTSASRHFPSHGNLDAAMHGTEGCFRMLLSHDPTHWDKEVRSKDIPLTLSGHTHATQFSLFGWCPSRYMFRQYRGLYTEGEKNLYVNIGLGETIFPARIGTRPEITLITLKTTHTDNPQTSKPE